jgi:DNA-binding SARP family transcriptional activator
MATSDGEARLGGPLGFRILGPLEVAVGPQLIEVHGARQQIVLAALLLRANGVVSVSWLQEALYGEDLPPTSRSQVQIGISSLRRLLASHGHTGVISTRANGYVITVADGQLDYQRFEELTAGARAARNSGQLDQAVTRYRAALRLWRGAALDGLDSQLLRASADRLHEERMAASEDRIALELDLGRHHELVSELRELAALFPLRERLRGQLMLALYRCDRVADALQVYQDTRQTLIDELGIEPGDRLQQLEHAILTCDPSLNAPAGPVTLRPARQAPRLLPSDIADFTGRAEHVEQIRRRLVDPPREHERRALPVMVITGRGGVGKTSVAVHASHQVADHFCDGQLFADLHGAAPRSVSPMRVLERFLRALGVPGAEVPRGLDERAEMYRNLLAGRRILVVLDDAAAESQVSPLLPGSGAAAVLITSRTRLSGLPGASHIELNALDRDQSLELLGRIVGADRVHAQAGAAAAVAAHCGYLPLALRLAGARLAARPHWTVGTLADRLADETRRLDELRHGELGVRASIALSYAGASEAARTLFRRLALLDAPVFSGWVSVPLLDRSAEDAEEAFDDLVRIRLVELADGGAGARGQFRFHELVRIFARERLAQEEPEPDQTAALERTLGTLLYLAQQAHRSYDAEPGLASGATHWPLPAAVAGEVINDPVAWFERERPAIMSGIRQAAQAGFTGLCWGLASEVEVFFQARAYFDDWREAVELAMQACHDAGDTRGLAWTQYSRGTLHIEQSRLDAARKDLEAAIGLFQRAGESFGFAMACRNAFTLERLAGRFDDATRRSEQALPIFRNAGDFRSEALVLQGLALMKLELGESEAARQLLAQALQLTQTAGDRTRAAVLYVAGEVHLRLGELSDALGKYGQALAAVRQLGERIGETHILRGIGVAKLRQGQLADARRILEQAAETGRAIGARRARSEALLALSELAVTAGDPREAVAVAQLASAELQAVGATLSQRRALILLSKAHEVLGDTQASLAAQAAADALTAALASTAPTALSRAASWPAPVSGRLAACVLRSGWQLSPFAPVALSRRYQPGKASG